MADGSAQFSFVPEERHCHGIPDQQRPDIVVLVTCDVSIAHKIRA